MSISFTFGADFREMQGKGASRRLRHTGKVPAILYGGHKEPRALMLDQQNLLTMIDDERFYSSIVQLKIGDGRRRRRSSRTCRCTRRKNVVVHVDLQRVVENEKIRIHLPIHFKGESISPGREDCRAAWCRICARTSRSPACRRICRSSSSWTSRA